MKFKNRVKTSVTKLENMPTRIQDQPACERKRIRHLQGVGDKTQYPNSELPMEIFA